MFASARAEVLPPSAVAPTETLMARRYRADMRIIKPVRAVQKALRIERRREAPVILAITPTATPRG